MNKVNEVSAAVIVERIVEIHERIADSGLLGYTDYVSVGAGACMYTLGLRQSYEDIDVFVKGDVFETLKDMEVPRHFFERSNGYRVLVLEFPGKVDVHAEREGSSVHTTGYKGVYFETPESMLDLKLLLNRDKDQKDIRILKQYIADNQS